MSNVFTLRHKGTVPANPDKDCTMISGLQHSSRQFGPGLFLASIAILVLLTGSLLADGAAAVPETNTRRPSQMRFSKPKVSNHLPSAKFRIDEDADDIPEPTVRKELTVESTEPVGQERTASETPASAAPSTEFRQSFVNEPGFTREKTAQGDLPFERPRPTLRDLLREDFVNPPPGTFDSDRTQAVPSRSARKNQELGSIFDENLSFDTPECVEWDPKSKSEAPAPFLLGLRPSMSLNVPAQPGPVQYPQMVAVPPGMVQPPQMITVPPGTVLPNGQVVPPGTVAVYVPGATVPPGAVPHYSGPPVQQYPTMPTAPPMQHLAGINAPQTVFPAVKTASAVMVGRQDIQSPSQPLQPQGPKIDLRPSHGKHLPNSEVNGVVVVQANFPLTEIRAILDEIRQLQHDLNVYMGIPAPTEKIELCLFKDEKSYLKFLADVFPTAPRDRRALYVKLENRPATLLVQRTEHFEIDLRHEMTHAIVHATIPIIPIWLDEGLAKYFEMPEHERATGSPYFNQILWNLRINNIPNMEKLEKLRDIDDMRDVEYRDSWAWTHFMIHNSAQTHKLLAGYLQLLAKVSKDDPKARNLPLLSRYMKEAIPQPRDAYAKHFRGMSDGNKKPKK